MNQSNINTNNVKTSPYSSLFNNNEKGSYDPYATNNKNNNTTNVNQIGQITDYKKSWLDNGINDIYINKVKNDANLLPIEFRSGVDFRNKINITTTTIYSLFCLANILKDYPEITKISKRNIFFSSCLFIFILRINKYYDNESYKNAYFSLSNKYGPEGVENLIKTYHAENDKINGISDRFVEMGLENKSKQI